MPTCPTTSRRSGSPLAGLDPDWISGYDLARGADLLIHDCQYTDAEYPERVGWGHSGLTDTLTFARRVEARRLMLFHHDPLHSDEFLNEHCASARRGWEDLGGDASQLEMGIEGAELELWSSAGGSASAGADPRQPVQAADLEVSTSG